MQSPLKIFLSLALALVTMYVPVGALGGLGKGGLGAELLAASLQARVDGSLQAQPGEKSGPEVRLGPQGEGAAARGVVSKASAGKGLNSSANAEQPASFGLARSNLTIPGGTLAHVLGKSVFNKRACRFLAGVPLFVVIEAYRL